MGILLKAVFAGRKSRRIAGIAAAVLGLIGAPIGGNEVRLFIGLLQFAKISPVTRV